MSQTDYREKTIDGVTYRVYMLDPFTASDLANDLVQIMAPSLGALGAVGITEKGDVVKQLLDGGDEDGPKIDPELFSAGIQKTIRGISKEKQREFIGILSKKTMIVEDGGANERPLGPVFSKHFMGKLVPMYQWLAFAIQAQLGDFFSTLGELTSRAGGTTARP
mgnify:CR=1 FL=1